MTSKICSECLAVLWRAALLIPLALLALAALPGCSVVGQPIAEEVADVVVKYCEREPYNARQLYRQTINAELAGEGHEISVTCSGDPEEE